MLRILIADDHAIVRQGLKQIVTETRDMSVAGEASNGQELLNKIKEGEYDVVVLDIKLGRYDGLDLLQDIRNAYYDLPVILCSAYLVFKYDTRSLAADYYVVKSFDLRDLKIKVQMAIEGNDEMQSLSEKLLKGIRFQERILPETGLLPL